MTTSTHLAVFAFAAAFAAAPTTALAELSAPAPQPLEPCAPRWVPGPPALSPAAGLH